MGGKSLDAYFEKPKKLGLAPKTGFNSSVIGGALGFAAGIAGGFYLGEQIRDYFEVLRYAHQQVRYSVDIFSSAICGGMGLIIGSAFGLIPGMYRRQKKAKK